MLAVTIVFAGGCAAATPAANPLSGTVNSAYPARQAAYAATPAPGAPADATAAASPHVITNLDQLSRASTGEQFYPKDMTAGVTSADAATGDSAGQSTVDNNLARLYLADPNSKVYSEAAHPAGEVKLSNDKARQYPEFCYELLNRTLSAMQRIEAVTYEDRRLPDDIKPVVIIAVLTAQGRLTDLTVEQRSGVAVVDRSVIEACKKGLWALNPPAGALAQDGTYRLRIEALAKNHTYNLKGQYDYNTDVGLAVL
jgi:hypothetical protein